MSVRFAFPSLGNSDKIYVVTSYVFELQHNNRDRRDAVAFWAGMREGIDTGIHSEAISLIPTYSMGDFLGSLANFLTIKGLNSDEMRTVVHHWGTVPHVATVLFLLNIRYKEGKNQYYNLATEQVSRAKMKAFDKRWLPVEAWANGSAESVYKMIYCSSGHDYHLSLDKYIKYSHIHKIILEHTGNWQRTAVDWMQLTEKHVVNAFDAVQSLVNAYQESEYAARCLKCYKDNMENYRLSQETVSA